jgi:NAD(P)H dehydrogenase (quinone)
MIAATIGGPESMYSEHGLNGAIATILFPINHGILLHRLYRGGAVPGPCAGELARYRARVLDVGAAPIVAYPKLNDYDEHYVLRTASPRSRTG